MPNGIQRTTTTTFRTGARRRPRPRRPALGRRSTTRTTIQTTAVRDRGGAARYILPALVVAGLAYLLWPRDAHGGTPPVGPPPITPPIPQRPPGPGPRPWPPGTPEASVSPAGTNPATGRPWTGMNVRTRPSPSAPLVSRNDAFRGTRIGIISIGHRQENPTCEPCQWYEVMTPGGSVGFARAVGPQGETNIVAHDPLPTQRIPVNVPIGGTEAPGTDIESQPVPLQALLPFAAPSSPLPPANALAALAPYAAARSYSQARW